MKGTSQVEEGCLSLESIETWDCVCVSFRGWMGKTTDWSAFEQGMGVGAFELGMVVGARRNSLSV